MFLVRHKQVKYYSIELWLILYIATILGIGKQENVNTYAKQIELEYCPLLL